MPTISQKLAEYIHGLTYADLPDEVSEIAGTRILDALSCAYDGHDLPYSRLVIELIKDSHGNGTVFGYDRKSTLADAAMANSVLVHSTVQVDNLPLAGHASTMVVPVALAVGEEVRASGKEVLVAIVLGYEVMQRVARGIGHVPKDAFRTGPVVGTIGAAAAAGRLMKLDAAKLANTLGLAANLVPGALNQAWWAGTMEPVLHAGAASKTAILSAMLAKAGAVAAPDIFEGTNGFLNWWAGTNQKADRITEELGSSFAMTSVTVKPYPVSGGAQLIIQTALPLAKSGLKAGDIRELVQKAGPGVYSYPGSSFAGPFVSHLQAIISIPFCVAATVLGRPVDSVALYAKHYDDPEVGELAKKIKLVEEPQRARPRTEVYTGDGRVLSAEEDPLNLEALSPSRKNMEKRFLAKAPALVGDKKAREIIRLVRGLEQTADIRDLTAKL